MVASIQQLKSTVGSKQTKKSKSKEHPEADKTVRLKDDDLIDFTCALRDQLDAGVDIKDVITQMVKTNSNPKFKAALTVIAGDLEKGKFLAESLTRYPRVFDSAYTSLIHAAEESGRYTREITATGVNDGIFDLLIEYLKRRNAAREHVKTALMYPLVVAFAILAALAAFVIYILPTLKSFFDLLITKPEEMFLITRLMFWATNFLTNYWWFLPIVAVGLGISAWMYWQTDDAKELWDRYQIRLKIIGPLFVQLNQAEILILMGTLLSSGSTIQDALSILTETVRNREIKRAIEAAKEYQYQGLELAESLKRCHWIFDNDIHMILTSAEKAGRLGSALQPFAVRRFERVDEYIARIVKFIEPALIGIAGVVVGFIAIGFYGGLSTLIKNMTH